jgi:imidazolonepropionase-like amidohydrolase
MAYANGVKMAFSTDADYSNLWAAAVIAMGAASRARILR